MEFRLRDLDPAAVYSVTDLDAPERAVTVTGAQLMNEGLSASIRTLKSAVFVYAQVRRRSEARAPYGGANYR